MTQDEIIRMAREVGLHKMIQVKHVVDKVYEIPSEKLQAFAALVAAHAKAEEQEPVIWWGYHAPLHAKPPKREWVSLTIDQIEECIGKTLAKSIYYTIEAKLKEKNCGNV